MKKLALILCALTTFVCFSANAANVEEIAPAFMDLNSDNDFKNSANSLEKEKSSIYEKNYSRRFIPFIRLGPEMTDLGNHNSIMPAFGFGFRSESNISAVDCSFSYARSETKEGLEISHVIAPKLTYLKYINSHSPSAIFLGFGSAWASIRNEVTRQSFDGLAGVLSGGIEYGRDSRIRQIYQIDIHQPVLGLKSERPSFMPIVEGSFSLGF